MQAASQSVSETQQPSNSQADLDCARRQLQDISIMCARASVSPDPRIVAIALAVLELRAAA